jgi:1-acyl-sn-glycerol-3-phosphate acyltransferase
LSAKASDDDEIAKFDPGFVERVRRISEPVVKVYFRAVVRGLESFPPTGGALMVSNHSGGVLTPDVFVLAPAFYKKLGFSRPLYTLAHYGIFLVPWADLLHRLGVIHASRENAAKALRDGAVVLVFPGGDYDAFRPTTDRNVIDFEGRTGYVRTAIEAGVPIVPAVSIGAQETQLFLTRGGRLARRLGLPRIRIDIMPFTFGVPFGLTPVMPPNFPLPSKIVTEVLAPIDIADQFGDDPDIDDVDAHVRLVMQRALDRLADERRIPVVG